MHECRCLKHLTKLTTTTFAFLNETKYQHTAVVKISTTIPYKKDRKTPLKQAIDCASAQLSQVQMCVTHRSNVKIKSLLKRVFGSGCVEVRENQ